MNLHLANKTILITGISGFIGSSLAKSILSVSSGMTIIGIDNMNHYYDAALKEYRLKPLLSRPDFIFIKGSIADRSFLQDVFFEYQPDIVVNLAAQAGVRYSITNPDTYMESNIIGFFNILECCRHSYGSSHGHGGHEKKGVEHLIYASSSSVYGLNEKVPYSTSDPADSPVSLYAATKKSNELMAHAYSKLYGIPSTGLRFFTVYGPAGRPDMAYFSFTNKLVKGEKIQLYNYGDMYRDFTYIDDIAAGILRVIGKSPDADRSGVKHKVYNIGGSKPESLAYFVDTLEECLMKEGIIKEPAKRELLPMQPGDVYQTYADIREMEKDFGFKPLTDLKEGLQKFAKWYKSYYLS